MSAAGPLLLAGLLRHKAGIEDAALAARHPDHAAYRARTGAFLPRLPAR